MSQLELLYEDNHVLAVNKPAGVVTMGALEGTVTLLDLAKDYIRKKYDKPGNVYLGIVSRLDAPVSGVVLLARTSKAADRLSRQFRERDVVKTYWAITSGTMRPAEGELVDWLAPDERHRRMHVVRPETPEAKKAVLHYRLLKTLPIGSLLEINLETGRKHQIRLQLASRGAAILGDRKYGSQILFPHGIALHALGVRFTHPVGGATIELSAPLPAAWRKSGVTME